MVKPANLAAEIKRREEANRLAPFPAYDTEIISDFKKLLMITKQDDYNNVPITYCKTCLSIKIKTVPFTKGALGESRDIDYCVPCGNTNMEETHIRDWEQKYEEKYGETFLNQNKDESK